MNDDRPTQACQGAAVKDGGGTSRVRSPRPTFPTATVLAVAVSSIAILALPGPPLLAAQETPERGGHDGSALDSVDSVVMEVLRESRVPGAVVVAVLDGRIVLSRGYGTADPRAGTPMSDTATVLTVGSLAKPLTATAALRLAARGEFDLDEDIRERAVELDLPLRHDEPVTAAHLLTHTSGFDDTDFGDAARRPEEAVALQERLKQGMPVQTFAPGRFHRYSNHGYALLGWLLQESEETDFAALLDRELFRPLGMSSSSFEQIPPRALQARMATGHVADDGNPRPVRPDLSNVVPADGLLTTGRDMGRFLLALTGGSESEGLPTEVREEMVETAFTYHDSLPGVTLALQERPVQDWSGLEHTGGRSGFTSQLVVVPEKRFGLFVALNLRDGAVRSRLTSRLLDVLLPESRGRVAISEDAVPAPATDRDRLTGTYRSIHYNRHTVEKLAVLLGLEPTVSVEQMPRKALRIGGGAFYEMEPLFFRWEEARWYNVFLEQDGAITHLASGHRAFERTAWWEDTDLHRVLFLAATVVLLLVLAIEGWCWARDHDSGDAADSGPAGRWTHRFVAAAAAVLLVGLGALAFALRDLASTADYGAPPALKVALAALMVGSLSAVPAVLTAAAAWVGGSESLAARLRAGAGALAAVCVVVLLWYWNLIGFNY